MASLRRPFLQRLCKWVSVITEWDALLNETAACLFGFDRNSESLSCFKGIGTGLAMDLLGKITFFIFPCFLN